MALDQFLSGDVIASDILSKTSNKLTTCLRFEAMTYKKIGSFVNEIWVNTGGPELLTYR